MNKTLPALLACAALALPAVADEPAVPAAAEPPADADAPVSNAAAVLVINFSIITVSL